MLHSRGFAPSENQAYAGQTRTPAASSRTAMSPHRRNMTTGRRPAGENSHLLGQGSGKQLFGDTMSSKTPGRPLGEKNTNKTPGPSRLGNNNGSPSKQGAGSSPSKGSGSSMSPLKKGGELSTRKAGSSNVLRSTNGKQKQPSSELLFGKTAMTPAPTELGKRAKTMSRQSSFVTPAANVGRAGQIKARMGEMMDAELGLSLPKANVGSDQATVQAAPTLTEEELYPEIEYMPKNHMAHHPTFEFPDELDNLPRAKEVGIDLATFSPFGIKRAGPEDLDAVEPDMMEINDTTLDFDRKTHESDGEDDPWPDVPVPSAVSRAASGVAPASRTTARPPSTSLARRTVTPSASASASGHAALSRARALPETAAKPVGNRTSGLQRSIAASGTPARPRQGTKPLPAREADRKVIGSTAGKPAAPLTRPGTKLATGQVQPKPKTMMNPALTDFVNDDLGKKTAEKMKALGDDLDAMPLSLDLGSAPEDSTTPP